MSGSGLFGLLIVMVVMLVPLALWIYCLVEIVRSDFDGANKLLWLLLVILLPLLGMLLYALIGRKQRKLGNPSATQARFCSSCGSEVNPTLSTCASCQQELPVEPATKNIGLVIAIVVAVLILGGIGYIGIMSAIAIPQFSSYREKGFNSSATSDLRNAKTSVDSYFADHNEFPANIEATGFKPSENVTVHYNIDKEYQYVITVYHKQGTKEFACYGDVPKLYFRTKGSSDKFQEM